MAKNYTIYCDESGQRSYGKGTDPYFVIAGLVVDAEESFQLESEIKGLKRAFWGSPDIEIKSNWIRLPEQRMKHYTKPYGVKKRDINALVSALYKWFTQAPIHLLASIVDKPLMLKTYKADAHYPGAVSYTFLLQRFQKYLEKRGSDGNVVFDDPSGKSPGGFEWRDLMGRQHRKLKNDGDPYTGTKLKKIGKLIFVDSKGSCLIQAADLVAYNVFRQFREYGKAWENSRLTTLPTYEFFQKMLPLFDKGLGGVFSGYGVIKWPISKKVEWVVDK